MARRGEIRIIGGRWRGRKLRVADIPDLRPTPDRIRETLFNWLAPTMAGAVCLDAFAGTGALGLEAASRGAAHVTLVETSSVALALLDKSCQQLGAENVSLVQAAMPDGVQNLSGPFDLVFLDPPWNNALLALSTLDVLLEQNRLLASARVYFELPAFLQQNQLPPGWCILKKTRAGEVHASLLGKSS